MSDTYNPLEGSYHSYALSKSITQRGKDMLQTFQGGKPRYTKKSRSKTKYRSRKKYHHSKYAYVYKTQQKPKHRSYRRK
jgi:hypothetical protein